MLLHRRAALLASILSLPSSPQKLLSINKVTLQEEDLLLDTVVDVICSYTPVDFRESIRKANNFLYRGSGKELKYSYLPLDDRAKLPSTPLLINNPEPDLLIEGTYDDPMAIDYFRCLEDRLGNFPARPSTGHIATSDPVEAGKWGRCVSIWPLGKNWAYCWNPKSSVFFPSSTNNHGGKCQGDEFILNQQLVDALRDKREVLFSSCFDKEDRISLNSAFLSIPIEEDEKLRLSLENKNYGLS